MSSPRSWPYRSSCASGCTICEQADTPASQDDAAEVTVDEVSADAAAELDEQKADEVSEGGPAPASEDADTAEDGVAPEVQPEPKS